jgi:3-oxoadipate enol-lactonase
MSHDFTLNVSGVRFACSVAGEGPDVLFLHGWMCNRTFWRDAAARLSRRYRVITFDFRGHGESDAPPSGYTIEQLADDARDVLVGLGIQRAAVIGHSMGGMVAQMFCRRHAPLVSRVVLVTTIASDEGDQLISKRIAADSERRGFADAFSRHVRGWFSEGVPPKVIDEITDMMLRTRETVALELVQSFRHFDSRPFLSSIGVPALVIAGGADASAVPAESKVLAGRIPGANLVSLGTCGHFPMVECAEVLTRVIDDFLSDAPG